jgi:aspartokinase
MAGVTNKLVHPRAVEICIISGVPIRVLNTFSDNLGTEIINDEMEKILISGIVVKSSLIMLTMQGMGNIDGILRNLTELGVVADSVSQGNFSIQDGDVKYDYIIIANNEYLDRCINVIRETFTPNIFYIMDTFLLMRYLKLSPIKKLASPNRQNEPILKIMFITSNRCKL